ncbi:TniB family NTP-binding protein [Hymenobacter defluvii]|uniref:TniB family NTP-binding protein n=1 Tax=Hymenobacter defluvii TaxID=2054411 RepID=A0ABS3TFD6_9BACT|nr:TniB family NTP-binding protein [Hymenobacter defluvii]MBO3272356.1 TniB family NTP-binding protein [Hymenobacter defluvii]
MEHLTYLTAKWLEKPDADRIRAILLDKWVPYTQAHHVLQFLAFLQAHPGIGRMPNLLLVGTTGNGKTRLLQYYRQTRQPSITQAGQKTKGVETWPVLYVQAPAVPDEQRFYESILDELQVPITLGTRTRVRPQMICSLLQDLGVRLLIVDEIQHVLAGTYTKQREVLNVLKLLANTLCLPLVFAGIQSAHNVILQDEQLNSRFERIELPRWTMNEEYLRLLDSLETLLPLQFPSHLSELPIASKLLALSEGTIGSLVALLKRLAVHAIVHHQERITLQQITHLEPSPTAGWLSADVR